MSQLLILSLLGIVLHQVAGHGMMLNPVSRSSVWRFYAGYPANYNDNELYCGGGWATAADGTVNCGLCGDSPSSARPRPNENTGTYGRGLVVAEYGAGQIIDISVTLTTNHKGFMKFSLCKLTDPSTYESGEDCFQDLPMADGNSRHDVPADVKQFALQIKLPDGLICDRCVLRWTYTAGNNWGQCSDGSYAAGCGPQETYRNCADVAIH